jgi:hypothetical protein
MRHSVKKRRVRRPSRLNSRSAHEKGDCILYQLIDTRGTVCITNVIHVLSRCQKVSKRRTVMHSLKGLP